MNNDGLTPGGGGGGSGTGPVGGGGTGPTRPIRALQIQAPHPDYPIRAILRGRQVGYAVPIERGRYLVRLPDSCAAPYEDRDAAMAALERLDRSPT